MVFLKLPNLCCRQNILAIIMKRERYSQAEKEMVKAGWRQAGKNGVLWILEQWILVRSRSLGLARAQIGDGYSWRNHEQPREDPYAPSVVGEPQSQERLSCGHSELETSCLGRNIWTGLHTYKVLTFLRPPEYRSQRREGESQDTLRSNGPARVLVCSYTAVKNISRLGNL